MPLPSMLTYNELNGEEVRHVLTNRFQDILNEVPYLQRHITLPRVRMTLSVKFELWADQPSPETVNIGNFTVLFQRDPNLIDTITAEAVDSTAPGGGVPPDEVREQHGLPIAQPARGPRDIGAQIVVADQYPALEGREVQSNVPGLKINRTGSGVIDGMPTSANATVAKIDQGPAGLRMGQMNRDAYRWGGPGGGKKE